MDDKRMLPTPGRTAPIVLGKNRPSAFCATGECERHDFALNAMAFPFAETWSVDGAPRPWSTADRSTAA